MTEPRLLANRYELNERLAGGGMGQVFRGTDRVLRRTVAIKTVDLAQADDTTRERFRREAVATAGLSDRAVVQVYDAGFDGDTAFLVMELLTGPSLSQKLHDAGPLGLEEGLRVATEVSRGLIAAHRIGVVHRDVKPGNVMYHNNEIKLVDFGIAQLSENMGATLTAPATAIGTAAYMAPEQASGQGASLKSDWYALGCLLMTMFTGKPPFEGDTVAVAMQQITQPPPRLSERWPDAPPALDALVARCLEKDPANRPDGDEVLSQLKALQRDPNAPTMLMGAVGGAAPAPMMAATQQYTATHFAATPTDHESEVRPVAPVPPVAPAARPAAAPAKRSLWPLALLMLLVVGAAAAAFAWFGPMGHRPGGTPATPTVATSGTPQPSDVPTAKTTKAQPTKVTTKPTTVTTKAAPTTTQPTSAAPTSAPPSTTSAPTQGTTQEATKTKATKAAKPDKPAKDDAADDSPADKGKSKNKTVTG